MLMGFKELMDTYCVTNRNMIASNMLAHVCLNIKLAAIPNVYTDVNESPTSTPKTDSEMKNMMTNAKSNRTLSSERRA